MTTLMLQALAILQIAWAQPDIFAKIRELKDQNKHTEIVQMTEKEIATAKDKDEIRMLQLELGLAAMELGDGIKALKALESLVEPYNNLSEYALYYIAKIYLKTQDVAKARATLHKILELSPNVKLSLEVNFRLATLENDQKRFREARAILQKLERRQRREEGYADVLYQLARSERALGLSGPYCQRIRKLFSNYPQNEKLATWGPRLSQNIFEGKPTYCNATTDDRKSRIKNFQWGGLGDRAAAEITDLRNQFGNTEKYELDRLEVQYHLHEGEVTLAMQLLKPYYETHKNDFNYLLLFGNVAARAGEIEAAVGSYYAAHLLNVRSKKAKQALYQAAFLSYQFQDYDGAARKFQEFVQKYSSSGLSRDAKWHLAWIRYLRSDFDGAYTAFNQLKDTGKRRRRETTSSERARYWMAMSLFRMGKGEQAKVQFESLGKNQQSGFYSIAAGYRLKKLETLLPKKNSRQLSNLQRLTRFSPTEFLLPVDDMNSWGPPVAVSEENESEESVRFDDIASEEEMDGNDEEVAAAPVDAGTTVLGEEEVERKTNFSNPMLVKRFERARELMVLGLNDWARWDLYDIERKTTNREYLKTLMSEYETVQNYHRSSYIGQVFFSDQRSQHGIEGVRYLWEHTYPKAYSMHVFKYSKEFDVPTELIWSIMRAETQYKKDAISPVGALGLMQVMPVTGDRIARMLNEKDFYPRRLLEPEMSIRIGSRYLQRLMKKFEGNVALVAAGYNAGPHRVRSWLSSFGQIDLDEFIEHIPLVETRNYVKKVVTNYQVYSQLYSNKRETLSFISEPLKIRFMDPAPTKETWEDI